MTGIYETRDAQRFWAVLEHDQPDDWRRAIGLSRDKKIAQLMARRHRSSRIVEVYLFTHAGQTFMATMHGDPIRRKPPIEKRTK